MTDEEKAERYVSPEIWGDKYYVNQCGDWTNEDMKKAHLDGLKEGRKSQWHDLRENPNDLPTTEDFHNFSKYVLCALKFNDFVFYQVMSIHYPSKTWIVADSAKNYSHRNVIAWCELPKFEE